MEGRVGRSQAGVSGAVNSLLLAVLNQLRRGVHRVKLDLVRRRDNSGGRGVQQDLEVLDSEVRDTNSLSLSLGDLLHLGPSLGEVPVGVMLHQVLLSGR